VIPQPEQQVGFGPGRTADDKLELRIIERVVRMLRKSTGSGTPQFPVGYVLINTTGTNPATELGYGTWTAFGAGRVLVGFSAGVPPFDVAEAAIGAATHTHEYQDVIEHEHDVTVINSVHGHPVNITTDAPATGGSASLQGTNEDPDATFDVTNAGTSVSASADPEGVVTGETLAANSLPEAIVVHLWKRTA
jgi:hypothetical protein